MSEPEQTAFIVTCRTIGDYLSCNVSIPPGTVRVKCMGCHADATISEGGALKLREAEALGTHALVGPVCRQCTLLLADKTRRVTLDMTPHGAELLERSEKAKGFVAELMKKSV
jgi:hypothetical protein